MPERTAVVVGLCAHGLSLTRALKRAGIPVMAIEANKSLPGVTTSTAELCIVDDINGPGLVDALLLIAPMISSSGRPILFLTNDTMIATIGTRFLDISDHYWLSWSDKRDKLLPLLRKTQIERRCRDTNLFYPKSRSLQFGQENEDALSNLMYPLIFKPDKPVSGYKTLVVDTSRELELAWPIVEKSLPAIVQEYVPGDDSQIYFAALYLDDGKVIARFEGRKLRSRPMGHTTVAISESNETTHDFACSFFEGLKLSGPVSLELKVDPYGKFWVIEPTVGRTDFWVGLCINDGINFPFIEYCHGIERSVSLTDQYNRTMWINGERDLGALLWLLIAFPACLFRFRIVGVLFDIQDLKPWLRWLVSYLKAIPSRIGKKVTKIIKMSPEN